MMTKPQEYRDRMRTSLEDEVDRMLGRLRGTRLSVTLYAFETPALPAWEVFSAAKDAFDPIGPVGYLPDGTVGLLYIGPSRGAGGRRALSRRIIRRLATALPAHPGSLAEPSLRMREVRAWSDQVSDSGELLFAVMGETAAVTCCPDVQSPQVVLRSPGGKAGATLPDGITSME